MEREQAFILEKMGTAALRAAYHSVLQVPSPLTTSPDLPQFSSCLQTLICVPSSFKHQEAWMILTHTTSHLHALMPTNAYTKSVTAYLRKPFCFHPCGHVRLYSILKTHTPLNESPLSSASTVLCYSCFHALPNGFSNAGTRFLSGLDRHFLLCEEMEIRHSDFLVMCCGKIPHRE